MLDRQGEGLFDKMNGIGAHEVIIETPDHDADARDAAGGVGRARAVGVSRARARPEAGQALPLHPDFQEPRRGGRRVARAYAQPADRAADHPAQRARRDSGARQHHQQKERCVYCDIVRQELDQRTRVIAENADFVAVSPYAPRFPFETWILPKRHGAHFEEAPRHEYEALARMLKETLQRMNRALETPPFNLIIHSAPFTEVRRRLLSLARGDHAEADEGRRLRVGERVLHQSHRARRSRRSPARGNDLAIVRRAGLQPRRSRTWGRASALLVYL